MSSYPYKQQKFTLFKTGRAICLLLFLTLCVFLAFQWAFQSFDSRTMNIITLSWLLVFGLAVFITLTRTISPELINQTLNQKAHYESALYGSLAAANEQPEAVRTELFEAYLTHLRDNGGNHAAHLRHLPPEVAKTAKLVCDNLLEKERLRLADTLQKPTSGAYIENFGHRLQGLEVLAENIHAHDGTSGSGGSKAKPSFIDMPSLAPERGAGMTSEA